MTTIITDTAYNFQAAENDLFSWSKWDGTNGNTLTHKPSGRQIYQMHWCDDAGYMAERVVGEVCEAVSAFWVELRKLQEQKPPICDDDDPEPEPQHGQSGYCRKCHSYCYGDCTASQRYTRS